MTSCCQSQWRSLSAELTLLSWSDKTTFNSHVHDPTTHKPFSGNAWDDVAVRILLFDLSEVKNKATGVVTLSTNLSFHQAQIALLSGSWTLRDQGWYRNKVLALLQRKKSTLFYCEAGSPRNYYVTFPALLIPSPATRYSVVILVQLPWFGTGLFPIIFQGFLFYRVRSSNYIFLSFMRAK